MAVGLPRRPLSGKDSWAMFEKAGRSFQGDQLGGELQVNASKFCSLFLSFLNTLLLLICLINSYSLLTAHLIYVLWELTLYSSRFSHSYTRNNYASSEQLLQI